MERHPSAAQKPPLVMEGGDKVTPSLLAPGGYNKLVYEPEVRLPKLAEKLEFYGVPREAARLIEGEFEALWSYVVKLRDDFEAHEAEDGLHNEV